MIMFAASTQNSVGRMFLGAMMPALLMITLLVAYVVISCWLKPEKAPRDSEQDVVPNLPPQQK